MSAFLIGLCTFSFSAQTFNADSIFKNQKSEIDSLKKVTKATTEKFDDESATRNITVVFLSLFLSAFFLIYFRYQSKQNNKYLNKINEQQNELISNIISVQEKERKRFAEDLHDGLGSILSAAKLNLERMDETKMSFTPDQNDKYNSVLLLLNNAIEELRNVSHNIMPASLSKLGLIATLHNMFDTISTHSGIKINFNTHDLNSRVDESIEINLYRIVLELLNNIVKHSKATEVNVQIIKYANHLNISIEDNGSGFDYEKIKKNENGIGLKNLNSRVNFMNGSLNIDSSEKNGTTVQIEIPLNS